jgi:VWFA-related protein
MRVGQAGGRVSRRCTLLFALCCASGLIAAHEPGTNNEKSGDGSTKPAVSYKEVDDATLERLRKLHYSESAQVRLVLVPANVTDRKGRVIRGLGEEDFRLYDDGTLQEIRYFVAEAREPVSIAFLLDVSGSMRQLDKLEHAKEGIRHIVDGLRPGDQFALICFADRQVAWITEFTEDRERFLKRLDVQEGYGQTALNDAVAATPGLVDDRIRGRKAIVLITDGVDNFSRMVPEVAVETARQVNVPIYTIGFLSVAPKLLAGDEPVFRLETMELFADETGGRLFLVHDPDELKEAILLLDNELRYQYVLGYSPEPTRADGRYHRIRVEVDSRRAKVRARNGYIASR